MRFPDLATTFKAVAKDGRDGFYKGRIAEAIVELIKVSSSTDETAELDASLKRELISPPFLFSFVSLRAREGSWKSVISRNTRLQRSNPSSTPTRTM